ncbi:hypothetical protein DPMN_052653 [Dreissena polymorpha]|uniref:Uncharacterized protein n=1 Tax=Dreissena polymorpha TaxID=45954 RepID=A0A9D4CK33_DREPO|nr:hypothetical protein DPMN_052653 [Dreissena polymorpha]
MSKPRKKMPPYKDVQLYQLVLQSCTSETHLVKKKNFNTSGECFTLAVCPVYTRELIMAAGIQLGKHPEREDIKYIVQIIRSNGEILQTLDINPLAEPCFTSRFFISATMKFGEIIVSEASNRRVRGIYMKTGKNYI